MTIYHVDAYYRKNDAKEYDVMPYSLGGTIKLYLCGFYRPRWKSIFFLIKWLSNGRFSEQSAQKLAQLKTRKYKGEGGH